MVRPKYERAADRDNQRQVLLKLQQATGLSFSLPSEEFAAYDGVFTLENGNKFVVEIKARKNERNRYPTYMLSKRKYDKLCSYAGAGVEALLAVQWTDQLAVVQLPVEHKVGTGGRYDRGDPMDMEQVVLIPVTKFKKVPE